MRKIQEKIGRFMMVMIMVGFVYGTLPVFAASDMPMPVAIYNTYSPYVQAGQKLQVTVKFDRLVYCSSDHHLDFRLDGNGDDGQLVELQWESNNDASTEQVFSYVLKEEESLSKFRLVDYHLSGCYDASNHDNSYSQGSEDEQTRVKKLYSGNTINYDYEIPLIEETIVGDLIEGRRGFIEGETVSFEVGFTDHSFGNEYYRPDQDIDRMVVSGDTRAILNTGGSAQYVGQRLDKVNHIVYLKFEYKVQHGDFTTNLSVDHFEGNITDLAGNEILKKPVEPDQAYETGLMADGIGPEIGMDPDKDNTWGKAHTPHITATDNSGGQVIMRHLWNRNQTAAKSDFFPDENGYVTDTGIVLGQPVPNAVGATGDYYLHILAYDDVAQSGIGNERGNEVIHSFGPYKFDNTVPTISFSPEPGTYQAGQLIQADAQDAHSGISTVAYRLDGQTEFNQIPMNGIPLPPQSGNYVFEVKVTDQAGNEAVVPSGSYRVDSEAPTVRFSTQGDHAPAKSRTVEVTIEGDHSGERGMAWMIWTTSLDQPEDASSEWAPLGDLDQLTILPRTVEVVTPEDENGTWYLHIKTEDEAGNSGYDSTQDGFLLDNIPPSISFSPNSQSIYMNHTATQLQIDGSSVDWGNYSEILYMINEQDDVTGTDEGWLNAADGSGLTDGTILLSNRSGAYYVHAKVTDLAGNTSVKSSGQFLLDHLAPTGSVQFDHDYTNQSIVGLTFTARDNLDRPIEMNYRFDEGSWSGWLPYDGGKRDMPLPGIAGATAQGTHTLAVKFSDEAGNESIIYSDTIIYDTAAPEILEWSLEPDYLTNGLVTVMIQYMDEHSQGDSVFVSYDENGDYDVPFADLAGNISTVHITIDNIDQVSPQIEFSIEGSGTASQSVTTSVYTMDNRSESAQITLNYAWSQTGHTAPTEWSKETIRSGASLTLADVDGTWYLWVKAVDEAGNASTVRSESFLLDNTPPVATITYSPGPERRTALPVTATLTLSDGSVINGSAEVIFKDNGSYEFIFRDTAGNEGKVTATVDWIDKDLPSANITYSPSQWTNKDTVEVTISVKEGNLRELLNIQAPDGAELVAEEWIDDEYLVEAIYRLPENGDIYFTISDLETGLENTGEKASVNFIDRVPPTGSLSYDIAGPAWTNKNVTVTLDVYDDQGGPVVVAGGKQFEFMQNGQHLFIFEDQAGNQSQIMANMTWIDKTPPQPIVRYSTSSLTKGNVTVTLEFDSDLEQSPVGIMNNGGSPTYTFTHNGTFTFELMDEAGNKLDKTITVDWIDREAPTGTLTYSNYSWTNGNVTVTIQVEDNSDVSPTIANNEGSPIYTFTENGSFTFELIDAAGNVGTVMAVMDRIDKTPPTADVYYSVSQETKTNSDVRVTISPNEPVTVLNNGGSLTYDFTDNGTFTFQIRDRAGNISNIPVAVNNIDRMAPDVTISYSTLENTSGNVIATVSTSTPDKKLYVLNNYNKNQYVFTENGSFTFIVQDEAGNIVEATATVRNIDKSRAEIIMLYSEEGPTSHDVTVKIQSDAAHPLTILGNGGKSEVTFTQNGITWLEARDNLGNPYIITIEVANIDREAPQIQFLQGETLIVPVGSMVDPLLDVAATDNLDGNLINHVQVQHNINSSIPGTYEITYRVSDQAGHETVVVREAQVVSIAELSVYINGMAPSGGEVDIRGLDVFLSFFGEQGETLIKWTFGKWLDGYMKTQGEWLDGHTLTIDRQGYYTFLIQDQERNMRLVHVYVIPNY